MAWNIAITLAILTAIYTSICATADNQYNNRATFITNITLKTIDPIKELKDPTLAQYVQYLKIFQCHWC